MRLLFLTHRVPYPPNKGDKIRAYHELRALTARGHRVHLATFADDLQDLGFKDALQQWCESVTIVPLNIPRARARALRALLGSRSLTAEYFNAREMHRTVDRIVRDCTLDAAVVYSSTMTQFVPPGLLDRTVADIVDVDSEKWRDYSRRSWFPLNLVFATEATRLARLERDLMSRFPRVIVSTQRELDVAKRLGGNSETVALVNGVDLEHFRPDPKSEIDRAACDVVFTGAMDYRANVEGVLWFCENVWPELSAIPNARLWIVGRRPARSVQRCAELPNVVVTGSVPDVLPYLQRATVVVVPLQTARGIQNKVLEGMACGRPTVVSTAVSECIPGMAEQGAALVAGDAETFVQIVRRLVEDRALALELADRGRKYVERCHRWEEMLNQFCDIVESTALGASREPDAACA